MWCRDEAAQSNPTGAKRGRLGRRLHEKRADSGRMTVKRQYDREHAPLRSSRFVAVIVPPFASIKPRQIASPSPVPAMPVAVGAR
jgi:hypothetical protein